MSWKPSILRKSQASGWSLVISGFNTIRCRSHTYIESWTRVPLYCCCGNYGNIVATWSGFPPGQAVLLGQEKGKNHDSCLTKVSVGLDLGQPLTCRCYRCAYLRVVVCIMWQVNCWSIQAPSYTSTTYVHRYPYVLKDWQQNFRMDTQLSTMYYLVLSVCLWRGAVIAWLTVCMGRAESSTTWAVGIIVPSTMPLCTWIMRPFIFYESVSFPCIAASVSLLWY